MADQTHIQWTDATWNPITGCSVVSAGCKNCYAMRLAGGRLRNHPSRIGLTRVTGAGRVWTGEVRLNEAWLDQPLRWRRPRRIFVCAHGDLFHPEVPDEWIDRVFAVMALAPQHKFQVLTKRPKRMREWFSERWQATPAQRVTIAGRAIEVPAGGETGRVGQVEEACEPFLERFGLADPDRDELWTEGGRCKAMQWGWPLPNVWLGVSVEDQETAEERIPVLLDTPAALRFISAEPLLGPVDLTRIDGRAIAAEYARIHINALVGGRNTDTPWHLDWVIVGGESGRGARPCEATWIRAIARQCREARVPCFVKQLGAHPIISRSEAGRVIASGGRVAWDDSGEQISASLGIRSRTGSDPAEWPADLRIREFPPCQP